MKLITELNESVKFIAEEGSEGKKHLYITGPFIQTEVVNRNGRKYVRETVEREVKRYTEQFIDKGNFLLKRVISIELIDFFMLSMGS